MICNACNFNFDDSGKFCPECGTPASAPDNSAEFMYLLSEEQIRRGEPDRAFPPYGCVAVATVNGAVYKLFRQKAYKGTNQGGKLNDWFKRMSEWFLGVAGRHEQNAKVYVVSALDGMPLVSIKRPFPIAGHPDAFFNINIWLNTFGLPANADEIDLALPENKTLANGLGLFIQKHMHNGREIKLSDLRSIASQAIESLLASQDAAIRFSEAPNDLVVALNRLTGLSGECHFNQGGNYIRHQIDVSQASKPVFCSECGDKYFAKVKFCGGCGNNMADPNLWVDAAKYLVSSDGEQVTLRLSMLINDGTAQGQTVNFDDNKASEYVIDLLGAKFKRTALAQMLTPDFLLEINEELNSKLTKDWRLYISGFNVTDIRTAKEDWFFQADAMIAEELRKVETETRFLKVGAAEVDHKEAAFAIFLRRLQQEDSEALRTKRQAIESRSQTLELRAQESMLEIQEHQLEETTELKKDKISDDIEAERLQLERNKLLRERQLTGLERENQVSDIDHDMLLEKKTAQHDIDLSDMTLQAQSRARRQEISDDKFIDEENIRIDSKRREEEIRLDAKRREDEIRLEAKKKQEVDHLEEDLEDRRNARTVDKLRAMAVLEANMARQEQEHEIAKREAMKNLDAAQMLAMQAAELAKAGGSAAAADIVKAIAQSQSDAAGTNIKEQMFREMLEIQRQSAQSAIEAHKSAAEIAQSTNEKSMESMAKVATASASQATDGFKEAAKIAQSTNEKSMESMSKVATAAAGKKTASKDDDAEATYKCACGKENLLTAKFCTGCGTARPKD